MTTAFVFTLPEPVALLVPDSQGAATGEEALSILTTAVEQIASYVDHLVAQLDPIAVLRDLSFQVAYGLNAADPEALKTDSPMDRPDRFGLPPSAVSIAARLVLERAVVVGQFGSRVPTPADVAELVTMSATHMQLDVGRDLASLASQGKKPGMGRVSVHKTDGSLAMMYHPEQFDLVGYQAMRDSRILDSDPTDNARLQAFQDGIPADFKDLSDAMISDLGFGVDDLLDVIVIGFRINLQQNAQFVAIDAEYFRSFAATSARGRAALDFLTFSSDYLAASDLRPSSTRHQKRRIVTHPFIIHDKVLILEKELLFEALNRWWRYLLNGDWPVPSQVRKQWPALDAAITARRDSRGTGAFEPFVEAELDRLGLPWGFTSGGHRSIGQAQITGEIDALVVDARRSRLWVIEAKDLTSDQNLRSLQTELKNMIGSYLPQVSRSASEVESDPAAVAQHAVRVWGRTGKVDTEDMLAAQRQVDEVTAWEVRPLMVVRDRSAAEFLIGKTLPISTVAGLRAKLIDS